MEEAISRGIIERYFEKLRAALSLDVAIAGAGPSGLVCARRLARQGRKVAIFERKLAPGGGVWGGGMLFNEVVVQEDVADLLAEYGVRSRPAGEGMLTCDSVELSGALIYQAVNAGATIFNSVSVEDIVFKDDRVGGVVINWTPVVRLDMHVDPLVVMARAVLDGTGHPSEICALAARKAGVSIDTETGGVVGEKPMWVEVGEQSTVDQTKRMYPGLYVSGMAANNVSGGYRMGPIFGGMLKSGLKAAELIAEDLDA